MVYQRQQVSYQPDNFEMEILNDFTGGLNITDPESSLPQNQFSAMRNYYYDRQQRIFTRPPYRPYSFSGSISDRHITTVIGGEDYTPKSIIGYEVFREDVSDWSYSGELHVVWAEIEDILGVEADRIAVMVFKSSVSAWKTIWSSTTAADVSVCSYKINEAFDLLIFPDNTNPERWISSTATMSDLGLTKPSDTDFDVGFTEAANSEGFTAADGQVVYYKYSYFYDDNNVSTKYGESASHNVSGQSSHTLASAGSPQQITLAFTNVSVDASISKLYIYRAPLNTPEGPYRYIGETAVTDTDEITSFVDSTPLDFEGVEDIASGSNPSLSGSELAIKNVSTIGAYVVGFSADIESKLIYSNPGEPDVWIPTNFDYLQSDGQLAIEFNRKIYVFTEKYVYEKETMESPATKLSNIGCIDKRTIKDVTSGLIWCDYDSVYFADFVSQYGSKGDFPKDIGHPISESVSRINKNETAVSEFFERRYYINYVDTYDSLRRTYVYDVDIGAWTEHSMNHLELKRGKDTLYSVGIGNDKYYVYEHDYTATVVIEEDYSDYAGKDYHDYTYVDSGTFEGIATIQSLIKKNAIRIGGEYRTVFLSSISFIVEGVYLNSTVSIGGNSDDFVKSKVFSNETLGGNAANEYPAVYNQCSYAPDEQPNVPTSVYGGYVGFFTGEGVLHKKFNRSIKARDLSITVFETDSRQLKILAVAFYYKLLPQVA